jgi:hypothetical protein
MVVVTEIELRRFAISIRFDRLHPSWVCWLAAATKETGSQCPD